MSVISIQQCKCTNVVQYGKTKMAEPKTKKTVVKKVEEAAPMNKGDLTAIIAGILLTKGTLNSVTALETAEYIINQAHK